MSKTGDEVPPGSTDPRRKPKKRNRSAKSRPDSRRRHGRQQIGATVFGRTRTRRRTGVCNDLAPVVDRRCLRQRHWQRVHEVIQVMHRTVHVKECTLRLRIWPGERRGANDMTRVVNPRWASSNRPRVSRDP